MSVAYVAVYAAINTQNQLAIRAIKKNAEAETHHVCQNIIILVVGLIPICAVARQSRPTIKMDV